MEVGGGKSSQMPTGKKIEGSFSSQKPSLMDTGDRFNGLKNNIEID